jgi:hypothetical protein
VLEGKINWVISSHLDNNIVYTNTNQNDILVFNDVQGFQLIFFSFQFCEIVEMAIIHKLI